MATANFRFDFGSGGGVRGREDNKLIKDQRRLPTGTDVLC